MLERVLLMSSCGCRLGAGARAADELSPPVAGDWVLDRVLLISSRTPCGWRLCALALERVLLMSSIAPSVWTFGAGTPPAEDLSLGGNAQSSVTEFTLNYPNFPQY